MSNDPHDLSRALANVAIARDILGAEFRPFYDRLSTINRIISADAALKIDAIATLQARRLGQVTESINALTTSANMANERRLRLIAESVAAVEEAIAPALRTYQSQSLTVAQALQARERDLHALDAVSEDIRKAVGNLNTTYILPELPGASIFGFGRLTALSTTVHTPEPYAKAVSDVVAEEIGTGITGDRANDLSDPIDRDVAAVQAGLQAELLAFPPSKYRYVMYEANFQLSIPSDDMPSSSDEHAASSAMPSDTYYSLFAKVENHLRDLIEQRLASLEGTRWMNRRVPNDIRERWSDRMNNERSQRRKVHRPIDYADFADLMQIICRGDNWRESFEGVFIHKDDLQVSFRRLFPVRNAIGHSRPLSRSDVLILVSESTRILTALGVLKPH